MYLKLTLYFALDVEIFAPEEMPDKDERGWTSCDESNYGDDGFIRHGEHDI